MQLLQTLRTSILMGFRALPLLLISFIGFLAVGLGNLGLFILFIGHALIVPLSTELMNYLVGRVVFKGGAATVGQFAVQGSDMTTLIPQAATLQPTLVAPSYWMAHVLFFMGYLLANASAVKGIPQDPKQSDYLFQNRQARANAIITMAVLGGLGISALRYFLTGAETWTGIFLAILVSGGLGMAWYQFAAQCGARHADVFGVVPAIVPATAKDEKAMACVFAPKP